MKYAVILLLLFSHNICLAQCASCGSQSSSYYSMYDGPIYSEYGANTRLREDTFVSSNENFVRINDISLAEENAKANNKTLLLIFTADWCKYCVPLKQQVQLNIDTVNKKFVVCYVDFDKNKDLAKKYNIRSLPSSVFVKDNGERRTIMGFSNFSSYKNYLGL